MNNVEQIALPRAEKPLRLHRKPMPVWARYALAGLFYGIGFPLTRVLALFGKWPMTFGAMRRGKPRSRDFTPTAHDVMICSYFKSGTNWTMHTALQIAHRGQAQFAHIHDVVPWIDVPPRFRMAVEPADSQWLNSPTGLRVIKTHSAWDDIVYCPAAKYIWVVRDPKDVFVSSYHFIKSLLLGRLMPTPMQWLGLFLSPKTPEGSWAKHVDGGWRNRHRDNVLFLTYEEMKADLPGAVRKMAALMGVALTEAEFAAVVAQSSFAHMKTIEHKFDPPGMPWAKSKGAMIRRGERGVADEFLNDMQKRRVDNYWRAELRSLGSDFPYDEAFAAAP